MLPPNRPDQPSNPRANFHQARDLNETGMRQLSEGRNQEALSSFERALQLAPRAPNHHVNRAIALERLGRVGEAESAFRTAISLDPQMTIAHILLANLLDANHKREAAIEAMRGAYGSEPNSCRGILQLAKAHSMEGDLEKAVELARRASEVDPTSVDALVSLGNLLQGLGRFEEAAEVLLQALDLKPDSAAAYMQLANGQKLTQNDRPMIERMMALLPDPRLPAIQACHLCYAIGKGLADLGDYETAMRYYDRANEMETARVKASGRAFALDEHCKTMERSTATYTAQFFDSVWGLGSDSEKPVFIVGMIRSGTTLVEQILSSHPQVAAAGELRFWIERTVKWPRFVPGRLDPRDAAVTSAQYLEILDRIGPDAARVTDKMPLNYMCLGHMHAVFPRARIIHCRRSPIDTCLSIYTTATTFAHTRSDIVTAYRQYEKAMAHWREILPSSVFIETDYEALIDDPEPSTRRLIEFLGLEWDDACLRHDQNKGAIQTPSLWQARQPIYKTSVEKWRKYEPWLGEFRELLQP